MKTARPSSPRRAASGLAGLSALALLAALSPGVAAAAEYTGHGDTGWSHDNKRDCCDDAVYLAQDDSAARCEDAGGVPRFSSSSRRGLCDWDASGDVGDVVYRCTATAKVACR